MSDLVAMIIGILVGMRIAYVFIVPLSRRKKWVKEF